ncbi:unnamed protein product [Vicia faba]|uniref:Reverse transcriptase zinc-binding domain-containing protein n=1 Tax=Vicia faba TaxID=3906 RepID=A0AAV1B229_VICFA|nr:unnamed protein product [Vicia faba]
MNIPKHSFIAWLAVQNRLKTRDRLKKMQIIMDSTCMLCGEQEESRDHLLFQCTYNRKCWQAIKSWLNWKMETCNINNVTSWINNVVVVIYQIWKIRNNAFWNQCVLLPKMFVKNIMNDVRNCTGRSEWDIVPLRDKDI